MSFMNVNEIRNEAGTTSFQTSTVPNGGSWGFRNKIINGGMDFWQRGTLFTGAAGYAADRWEKGALNSGVTKVEDAAFGNVLRCYKNTSTTQWQYAGQRIELPKIEAGETYTVSFWIKWNIYSYDHFFWTSWVDGTQLSGTADFGINNMGEDIAGWQKITHTFVIQSDATDYSYYDLRWHGNSDVGTVDYDFEIAQVQFEKGSVATPFEQRPLGLELLLCQKYLPYWSKITAQSYKHVGMGTSYSTTACEIAVPIKTDMASEVPTVTWGGSWQLRGNGSTVAVTNIALGEQTQTDMLMLTITTAGSLVAEHAYRLSAAADASAWIHVDAEL